MFKSTRRFLSAAVGAALIALVVVLPTAASAQRRDMDCADFSSQRSAQIFFADHDGIACEDNPAPYLYAKHR